MVVVGSRFGMLANRMWRLSHFMAFSVAHDIRVVDPWFDEYKGYFVADERFPHSVGLGGSAWRAATSFNLRLLRAPWVSGPFHRNFFATEAISMDDPAFIEEAEKKKICLCYGFLFRARDSFLKHSQLIRHAFSPVDRISEQVERLVGSIRDRFQGSVLVGVHIRRGDYRSWRGGAFFFSDESYYAWCQQIQIQLQSVGKNAVFLICSDSSLNKDQFVGLDVVEAIGTEIGDLYSLAKCDMILGPPSTYTKWASFYGEVPLFHCHRESDSPKISDFSILRDDYIVPFD